MVRNRFGIGFLLAAAFGAAAAKPGPINYTINFTTTAGVGPTAGAFTYDAATSTFTNFLVTWDGLSFNLTSSANAPGSLGNVPSCVGGTGPAAAFALLNGACVPPDPGVTVNWQASNVGPTTDGFIFSVSHRSTLIFPGQDPVPGPIDGQFFFFGASATDSPNTGEGQWTITASQVVAPEPASLILVSTSLLAAGAFRARRRIAGALGGFRPRRTL